MAIPVALRGANATVVQLQSGPTSLKSLVVVNSSAATAFVQLFNGLVANITLGTTGALLQVEVGAGAMVPIVLPQPEGLLFGSGLCVASTTTDGGSTGSAAGVEVYVGVN